VRDTPSFWLSAAVFFYALLGFNALAHGQQIDAGAKVALLDLEVRDQHDTPMHFQRDVLGDKIVAVNFIFTSCTTVCPAQSLIFAKLQTLVGKRLGKDMELVSVSIDPLTDSPARLKRYAEKQGAKPGWRWITGGKPNIDRIVAGFDALAGDFADHPAVIFVGDPRSGQWTRFNGFPQPQRLAQRMRELAAARQPAGR
jgi:protein SCO1/2